MLISELEKTLAEFTKNPEFRLKPKQAEVLELLQQGKNVFASLPTGYGKSLCFWSPALCWGWKVWVISPLVSLMEDQSSALAQLGLPVIGWAGNIPLLERRQKEEKMRSAEAQVVLLSPERLLQWEQSGFLASLEREGLGPDLLALDEVHCFEEWRSFRSAYGEAFSLIRKMHSRGAQVLGLSASLSEKNATLWMKDFCEEFTGVYSALERGNIYLAVQAVQTNAEKWLILAECVRSFRWGESILVYCATRLEVDDSVRWLRSAGFPAFAYHAGLPKNERTILAGAFRAGRVPILCATSAFGMGIDFPRVRKVVHLSLPYSMESYWQEVGRAGRDGKPAEALLLWQRSEILRARLLKNESRERFKILWKAFARKICRKKAVALCFGLQEKNCDNCDSCGREGKNLIHNLRQDASSTWWARDEEQLCRWIEKKFSESGECS